MLLRKGGNRMRVEEARRLVDDEEKLVSFDKTYLSCIKLSSKGIWKGVMRYGV